jgi:hypothetical protein
MLFQNTIPTRPFKQWIRQDAENKRLCFFSLVTMVVSFTWLKIIYPYPNFMPPDSYSYLDAAQNNDFINMWPIGYSRFLRLVSSVSQSHLALIILQYVMLQASILYFLFTIRYLLSPGKWLFRILLGISIINPLIPHIANFVSSDCLFAALSLIWFTQLLWVLYQPSNKLLVLHALILVAAFTVRFMALYYPFFSIVLILLKHMPQKTRWIGIGAIVFLLLAFIGHTQYEYKIKTGIVQYSAFGGWQLAANALYGYAYVQPDDPATVPGEFRELHTLVNQHMDSLRKLKHRPDKEVGIYYLWDFKSPLQLYKTQRYKNDNKTSWFKQWASMAPIYQQYGRWLMMKHPLEFTRYYLWPNFLKYYAPPVKFMGSYNLEAQTVWPIAVTWFGWQSNQLPTRSHDRIIHVAYIFPTLLSIINPLFVIASIVFAIFGGFNKSIVLNQYILGLMLVIWLGNMFFSVLSAPTELRYQLFPIIITIPFCGFFIAWIIQSLQIESSTKQNKQLIQLSEPAT